MAAASPFARKQLAASLPRLFVLARAAARAAPRLPRWPHLPPWRPRSPSALLGLRLQSLQSSLQSSLRRGFSSMPPSHTAAKNISPKEAEKAFRLARQALINNVDGFGARTMLRIRLFLMGQVRPMKMDDIIALFSWIFVGNTLFVLARTTAFVSVIVFIINSLNFQERVSDFISDYLTKTTGFQITFESAIVPRWREGVISLENVSILCNGESWTELRRKAKLAKGQGDLLPGEVDTNFTYWDLNVDRIDLTLSLWRMLDGRGPLKAVKLQGVRGVVDRRHIVFDPNWVPTRRIPGFGDLELSSLVVKDLLVTIQNPNFRPYSVSIFDADLPLFRQQWLLYDLMCADSVVGMFDNCLFSVHRSQSSDLLSDTPEKWGKISHLKMNALPIGHLNAGATGPLSWITRGTVDLDLQLLIPHKPSDDHVFEKIMDELDSIREVAIDKFEEVISGHPERQAALKQIHIAEAEAVDAILTAEAPLTIPLTDASASEAQPQSRPNQLSHARHYTKHSPTDRATPSSSSSAAAHHGLWNRSTRHSGVDREMTDIVMRWKVRLNDVKTSVPIINPHLSYMTNALIRPVVAYMNSNRTSIPFAFNTKMDVNNFNGAWDIFAAGIVDVLSEETGRILTDLVRDERETARHLRRVGLWSLQELSKNVVTLVEVVRGNRKPWAPTLESFAV
eukprot:jgi/Hompol1/4312/HPOL_002490-RA